VWQCGCDLNHCFFGLFGSGCDTCHPQRFRSNLGSGGVALCARCHRGHCVLLLVPACSTPVCRNGERIEGCEALSFAWAPYGSIPSLVWLVRRCAGERASSNRNAPLASARVYVLATEVKAQRRLTHRSSGHAPACRSRPSFHFRPYASSRRVPLSSNVRPRIDKAVVLLALSNPGADADRR